MRGAPSARGTARYRAVEAFGLGGVEPREVAVEHDLLASHGVDQCKNPIVGNEE
jgi:hypothetical protein